MSYRVFEAVRQDILEIVQMTEEFGLDHIRAIRRIASLAASFTPDVAYAISDGSNFTVGPMVNAPLNAGETMGARMLQELLASLPSVLGTIRDGKTDPSSVAEQIIAARAAGHHDISALLEEELRRRVGKVQTAANTDGTPESAQVEAP